MKAKILVGLKTKYKTFGFSDKAFDGVADYLSKTVTEEGQIETAIGGVEGLLKVFQGDVDFVRNEKSGLQKQLDELKNKQENPTPTPSPNPQPEDMATIIANAVSAAVAPLSDKFAVLEQNKALEQRNASIVAKAKEYGIPDSFAKRYNVPADADLDEYFKDAKQELSNLGFKDVQAPESPEARMQKEGESIAEAINAQTKEIVEQKQK